MSIKGRFSINYPNLTEFSHFREVSIGIEFSGLLCALTETILFYPISEKTYLIENFTTKLIELEEEFLQPAPELNHYLQKLHNDVLLTQDVSYFDYLITKTNMFNNLNTYLRAIPMLCNSTETVFQSFSKVFGCSFFFMEEYETIRGSSEIKVIVDVGEDYFNFLYPKLEYYENIEEIVEKFKYEERYCEECVSCRKRNLIACACCCYECTYNDRKYYVWCPLCRQLLNNQYLDYCNQRVLNEESIFKSTWMRIYRSEGEALFEGTFNNLNPIRSLILASFEFAFGIEVGMKYKLLKNLVCSLKRLVRNDSEMKKDIFEVGEVLKVLFEEGREEKFEKFIYSQAFHTILYKLTIKLEEENNEEIKECRPMSFLVRQAFKILPFSIILEAENPKIFFIKDCQFLFRIGLEGKDYYELKVVDFHNSEIEEEIKIQKEQSYDPRKYEEEKNEKIKELQRISPAISPPVASLSVEKEKQNKECMYCRKIVIRPACENYCCCRDCMNIRIREGKSPQRSICHKCSLPLSHKQILTYTELPKQTIVRCDVCKDNIYIRFVWILCIKCRTQICIDCLRYSLRKKNCGRCGCLYTFRQNELNYNYELRYTLVDCCNHYLQDVEILEIDSDRYIIHRACKETFYRIIRTKNFK